MSTKPSSVTGWLASGSGAGITEPSNTLKTNGFANLYAYPAENFNWFWAKVSEWVQYLNDVFPDGEIVVGEDIVGSAANARKARFKLTTAAHGTSVRTLLWQAGLFGSNPGVAVYSYTADSLGYALEFVWNATFDGTDWARTAGSTDSAIVRVGFDGEFRLAWRDSGAASPWGDSYGGSAGAGTGWTAVWGVPSGGGSTTVATPLLVTGATSFSDAVGIAGDLTGSLGGTLNVGAAIDVGTDAAVGDDLTVTDDANIGGDLDVTGQATIGGHTTISAVLTVSNDIEGGGGLDLTGSADVGGDVDVVGRVDAATGLGYTPFTFIFDGFTGAGPDRMKLHNTSVVAPAHGYLLRAKAGKIRSIVCYLLKADGTQMVDVQAGRTVVFDVREVAFDTGGAETSDSSLITKSIGAGDHWNTDADDTLNVDYAGFHALVVEASVLGGVLASPVTIVCEIQVQE